MLLQINKDPDVRLEQMFVLGEEMPKRVSDVQCIITWIGKDGGGLL